MKEARAVAGLHHEAVRKALAWVRVNIEYYTQRRQEAAEAREQRVAELQKNIKDFTELSQDELSHRHFDMAERRLQQAMGAQSELDRLVAKPLNAPDVPKGLLDQSETLSRLEKEMSKILSAPADE